MTGQQLNGRSFIVFGGNGKEIGTMYATVKFQLSEVGQKDALAKGLAAQKEQEIQVPAENGDLQYFHVAKDGSLSLNLHHAASAVRSWNNGWANHSFDHYPSAEEILEFLRGREAQRQAVIAVEQAEKEAKTQAEKERLDAVYEKFCSLSEEEQEATKDSFYDRVKIDGVILEAEQFPVVAEALQRRAKKQREKEEKAKRLESIPNAPKDERVVTLQADGTYGYTCPGGQYDEKWAKRLTGVDTTKRGGYALQGIWLTGQETYRAEAGTVIAVGSKEWSGSRRRGSYVSDFALYVVTPLRLIRVKLFDGVSPSAAADLFSQTPEERIEAAYQKLLTDCQRSLEKLAALDRTEYTEELTLIEERAAAWQTLKEQTEKAIEGADPESNIVDIDSAAAAIVSAGYRELAKRYHPDTGGSAEVMALLNTAKSQLVEILSAVREAK